MTRDFLEDAIEHSWGTKPEQKKREKEYNHQYYLKNKEKWLNTDKPLTKTISSYQNALLDSGQSFYINKQYKSKDKDRQREDYEKYIRRGKDFVRNLLDKNVKVLWSNERHSGSYLGGDIRVKVSPSVARKAKNNIKKTINNGKNFIKSLFNEENDFNNSI